MDPAKSVSNVLAGYNLDAKAVTQQALDGVFDAVAAAELVVHALDEFYRVKSKFDGKIADDIVRTLTKANANKLDVIVTESTAHQQLTSQSP